MRDDVENPTSRAAGARDVPSGPPLRHLAAVFVGSAAGTGLRWIVGALPYTSGSWPWGTFLVNLSGAFLLGYLLDRLRATRPSTTAAIPLLCSGLLGGYTTFSLFAFETRALAAEGLVVTALAYALASIVGGVAAAAAGMRLAQARLTKAQTTTRSAGEQR